MKKVKKTKTRETTMFPCVFPYCVLGQLVHMHARSRTHVVVMLWEKNTQDHDNHSAEACKPEKHRVFDPVGWKCGYNFVHEKDIIAINPLHTATRQTETAQCF